MCGMAPIRAPSGVKQQCELANYDNHSLASHIYPHYNLKDINMKPILHCFNGALFQTTREQGSSTHRCRTLEIHHF
jgi:hypothetical protein